MIPQYTCVRWRPGKAPAVNNPLLRLLGVDRKHDRVAVIDVNDEAAKIQTFNSSLLKEALKAGEAFVEDPPLLRPPKTPGVKAYLDETWNAMKPFRDSDGSYLFDCHKRAKLVALAMKISGKCQVTIRDGLRRFLQSGCIRDAMICKYPACGKLGLLQRAKPQKLRGRKSRFKGLGIPRSQSPLTPEDVKIFEWAIKEFLMGTANRGVKRRFVYDHYIVPKYGARAKDEGPEAALAPAFSRFNYFIYSTPWNQKIKDSRKTSAARGTGGRAKNNEDGFIDPSGPGHTYQIDSTQADIALIADVAGKKKWVIGRVTVYLVVDVFSHLIVGVHVTLGAPSYQEAVMALLNVLEDKVAFCAKYGIKLDPKRWPNAPLPTQLISDRQEFIYKNSDFLHQNLGLTPVNTPKYRGDFKAMVESCFLQRMKVIWTFPGGADPEASKDEKSYRTDAVLTRHKFTKLLICDIIKANNRVLKGIAVPPEATRVPRFRKTPARVFAWGAKELMGVGKAGNLELVRRALLPKAKTAHTYPEGLRVTFGNTAGIFYSNKEGKLPKKIFEPGNHRDLVTQVDERTMKVVYVVHPETGETVTLPISKRSREFTPMTWYEGAAYQYRMTHINKTHEQRDEALNRYLDNVTDETIHESVDDVLKMPRTSKAEMLADEKLHRKGERDKELSERAQECDPPTTDSEEDCYYA